MAGVVRRYKDHNGIKICAYIRIIEISETSCTVGTKRRDEMEFDLEHTWTYTIEDAAKRNSLKQKQWKEMPKNMLHKRCLTALLRAVYPEIIGQSYSPDELAECMIQDEKLRDEIVFASATGERVPKSSTPPKQDDTTPF
jgi:hypothetical protein